MAEISLNFAAFGALARAARAGGSSALLGRAIALANPFFQIESLLPLQREVLPALGASLPRVRASPRAGARRPRGDEDRGTAPEAPVRPSRTAALFFVLGVGSRPVDAAARLQAPVAQDRAPLGSRVGRARCRAGGDPGRDRARRPPSVAGPAQPRPRRRERSFSPMPGSTSSRRARRTSGGGGFRLVSHGARFCGGNDGL